jgi:hypothetical protein
LVEVPVASTAGSVSVGLVTDPAFVLRFRMVPPVRVIEPVRIGEPLTMVPELTRVPAVRVILPAVTLVPDKVRVPPVSETVFVTVPSTEPLAEDPLSVSVPLFTVTVPV